MNLSFFFNQTISLTIRRVTYSKESYVIDYLSAGRKKVSFAVPISNFNNQVNYSIRGNKKKTKISKQRETIFKICMRPFADKGT